LAQAPARVCVGGEMSAQFQTEIAEVVLQQTARL
jgi:hypothetical protein